jgi:hypothetical protein
MEEKLLQPSTKSREMNGSRLLNFQSTIGIHLLHTELGIVREMNSATEVELSHKEDAS